MPARAGLRWPLNILKVARRLSSPSDLGSLASVLAPERATAAEPDAGCPQPLEQLLEQALEQPEEQALQQSEEQAVEQPVEQAVEQPVEQAEPAYGGR